MTPNKRRTWTEGRGLQSDFKPSKIDLAYLSGLVDGEGSIIISKTKSGSVTSFFSIAMVGKPPISLVSKVLGIRPRLIPTSKMSKPKVSGNMNRQPLWCAQVSNQVASDFLTLLLPYLRLKKRQAKNVIQVEKFRILAREKRPNGRTKKWRYGPYRSHILRLYDKNRQLNAGKNGVRPK